MNVDWLLVSCIAAAVGAVILAFMLGACWLAGEADEQTERDYADRIVRHGDQHPWMER